MRIPIYAYKILVKQSALSLRGKLASSYCNFAMRADLLASVGSPTLRPKKVKRWVRFFTMCSFIGICDISASMPNMKTT